MNGREMNRLIDDNECLIMVIYGEQLYIDIQNWYYAPRYEEPRWLYIPWMKFESTNKRHILIHTRNNRNLLKY